MSSLPKAGVKYATLWSDDFTDEKFTKGLAAWLKGGAAAVKHDLSHVKALGRAKLGSDPLLATAMQMVAGGALLLLAGSGLGEWTTLATREVSLRG